MDLKAIKRCLTVKGFLASQQKRATDRDILFLHCAWRVVDHLVKSFGVKWFETYHVALCREGEPEVSFIAQHTLNLGRFFAVPEGSSKPLNLKNILEEGHCAQGVHVDSGSRLDEYAFDIVSWVKADLDELCSFFAVPATKVPGKVSQVQWKSGSLAAPYQYNVTCSRAMIIGMALEVREKLAGDRCNGCGKDRGQGKLNKCKGCLSVHYCDRQCQLVDWKAGHKADCPMFARWASEGVHRRGRYITSGESLDTVEDVLQRMDPEDVKDVVILV